MLWACYKVYPLILNGDGMKNGEDEGGWGGKWRKESVDMHIITRRDFRTICSYSVYRTGKILRWHNQFGKSLGCVVGVYSLRLLPGWNVTSIESMLWVLKVVNVCTRRRTRLRMSMVGHSYCCTLKDWDALWQDTLLRKRIERSSSETLRDECSVLCHLESLVCPKLIFSFFPFIDDVVILRPCWWSCCISTVVVAKHIICARNNNGNDNNNVMGM